MLVLHLTHCKIRNKSTCRRCLRGQNAWTGLKCKTAVSFNKICFKNTGSMLRIIHKTFLCETWSSCSGTSLKLNYSHAFVMIFRKATFLEVQFLYIHYQNNVWVLPYFDRTLSNSSIAWLMDWNELVRTHPPCLHTTM